MRSNFKGIVLGFLLATLSVGAAYSRGQDSKSATAAPAAPRAMRVRVGGSIMQKQITYQVRPVCPADVTCASAAVVLHAIIAEDGSIESLDFVSGSPLLVKPALDATRQWRYKPVKINGMPVEVDTTIEVAFDPASGSAQDAPNVQAQSDPWTPAETVTSADLVKELGDSDPAKRPVVACVGFKFLYDGGHVPGASFHGPASKDEGLADLKAWAQGLPKSSNVVLYCGCCPMERCPNLRPAFAALHDAGFARLRVLLLPTNFATDWAGKGYAIERSKQ